MSVDRREPAKHYLRQELDSPSPYDRDIVERFIAKGRTVHHVVKEFED